MSDCPKIGAKKATPMIRALGVCMLIAWTNSKNEWHCNHIYIYIYTWLEFGSNFKLFSVHGWLCGKLAAPKIMCFWVETARYGLRFGEHASKYVQEAFGMFPEPNILICCANM